MQRYQSPVYSRPVTLVPVNLHDEEEIQELTKQRKVCGWNYEREVLEKWRDQIERGSKFMWWIVVPAAGTKEQTGNQKGDRAGHIALASETSPPDPELARSDRSILTVSSFFILPQHRKGGLGRATWIEVENKARQIPECKQIAIDTLDSRYSTDDGPEWGGVFKRHGWEIEKELINEQWYTRMGYEKFGGAPRYPIPGTDELLKSVYLRKYIA